MPEDRLYIKWKTTSQNVWEFSSGQVFQGRGFEGRAEVPTEKIRQLDFFLSIHKISFSDEDVYECFYEEMNGAMRFLGYSHLIVTAHRDSLTLPSGASLSLPLHSCAPVEVLFAAAGEGAFVSVCTVERGAVSHPGPGYEFRVSVQNVSLTLRSLTAADQGQYTVRESETQRTISTVSVSVEGGGQHSRRVVQSLRCAFISVYSQN
ncbi:uncharacterized protein LOC136759677 [Amia ocellicauda]|uniref:uncharacterized protein LOC136759677 n=1 Tax=Amia ocellicauda TaxID=2972642 RepID=UPI0034639593